MSIDRREFLKIAGLAGLGVGVAGMNLVLRDRAVDAAGFLPEPKGLVAKRWAMVVDLSKFRTDEDYRRVIGACRWAHNVPDIGNKKDEVKWIWTEEFEHAF
ncbi:MAG TPA: twin-arginine translocation signal domain-containing protein, partial [Nitrospirae bacterium]|nr:twin-arginine translocation signal domain-containing protein [Nitrospirota bacterium]